MCDYQYSINLICYLDDLLVRPHQNLQVNDSDYQTRSRSILTWNVVVWVTLTDAVNRQASISWYLLAYWAWRRHSWMRTAHVPLTIWKLLFTSFFKVQGAKKIVDSIEYAILKSYMYQMPTAMNFVERDCPRLILVLGRFRWHNIWHNTFQDFTVMFRTGWSFLNE